MNHPIYCRTQRKLESDCKCYRCRPVAKAKPASAPKEKKL